MAITLTKSYQLLAETKLGSWGYGTLYLREYGKYDSQSIADNTTTYTLKLAIYCDGDYCNSGNCYAYISGTCIQDNTNLTFPTNGEITLGTKTPTVTHNDDGTRGVEEGGSFSCYAGTNGEVNAYFELPKIARYATISQSLNSKTETTAKINWTSNSTIDYLWYSIDNGTNWTGIDITDAKSGTYTISGLTEYTNYKVKTRVRRKDNQLISDSTSLTVITYPYPYCTSTPNFTIGNKLTLTFYNPLSRNINITGIGEDGSTIFTGSTTGTSLTGFNDTESVSKQYESIPSSKSGKYQVQVTYNGITKTRDNSNTYSIKGTEKPTFTNFTFADTSTNAINLTGNNQIFIKGISNATVTISTANKAIGNNSASISKYRITIGETTGEVTYSNSADVSYTFANVTTGTITVSAIDSRGLQTTVAKTATFKNWNKQIYDTSKVDRENGVGTIGLLTLKVNFWNNNFGTVDNEITKFSYRYKKTTDSSYSSYINITDRMQVNEDGDYYININDAFLPSSDLGTTATEFEVGYEYNIQFACVDKTQTIAYSNVLTLNSGIPCTAKQKNSDGTYSIGVNKLPSISSGGGLDIDGGIYASDIILSKNKHIMSYRNIVSENYTFNQAITPGVYSVQSETGISDGPYTTSIYGILIVYTNTMTDWNKSNNWIFQVFINTGGTVYTRYAINSNSFTDWGNGFLFNGATQKIVNTSTNPTTDTWYTIPFISGNTTGRYGIMSNNGLRYTTMEGTTSANGYGRLLLGNGIASGTAGNKYGIMELYSTGSGSCKLKAAENITGGYSAFLPAENGTLQLKPTSLYANTTGTNGTITLSETAANFAYIEIFYSASTGNVNLKSVKVSAPNSKVAHLDWCGSSYLYYARKTISGTSITTGNYARVTLTDGTTSTSTNQIYIYKVIGYK